MFLMPHGYNANNPFIFIDVVEYPVLSNLQFPIREDVFSKWLPIFSFDVGLMGELGAHVIKNDVPNGFCELFELLHRTFRELDLVCVSHCLPFNSALGALRQSAWW